MGLRRAFAGAAIGGLVGGLLGNNVPGLSQVGFTAGLLSGGRDPGARFVDNHPRWAENHPRASSLLENPGSFGPFAGDRFAHNHPGWAMRHPYAADRLSFGGPSLAGSVYPTAGIAASGGAFVGGTLSNMFNTVMSGIFGNGAPAPEQPRIVYGGPSFTPSGFNSV